MKEPSAAYKRVLTVQDISCVGQCSLTVALPILSACGMEAAVLPSAILSTHTAGFGKNTFHDLTSEMPEICRHWRDEGIFFDAIYTGYLGSKQQIAQVRWMIEHLLKPGGITIVDPVMADDGRLYSGFTQDYVEAMKKLVSIADYTLPNITEAALLTGLAYRDRYDESDIRQLVRELLSGGAKNVILTGVSYDSESTGVLAANKESSRYYRHALIPRKCHGTGDIFASAFTGALLRGHSSFQSAAIAAQFTFRCIQNTADDAVHWYGVKFEPMLMSLIRSLTQETE